MFFKVANYMIDQAYRRIVSQCLRRMFLEAYMANQGSTLAA
jgi:hypothetical protein